MMLMIGLGEDRTSEDAEGSDERKRLHGMSPGV
jgi:hypothetical protein